MPLESKSGRRYNAFLSYASKDAALADRIRASIEGFLRTPLGGRGLRVFQDRASLAGGARLWSNLARAIDDSQAFIWVASPTSAASDWAAQEFEYWLNTRPSDSLIIVLAGGAIEWARGKGSLDAEKTTAIPRALLPRFKEAPKYLDYRWVGDPGREDLLRDPRFQDLTGEIAAELTGRPKDDLIGQHVTDEKRARRFRRNAIAAVAALCITAAVAGFFGYRFRVTARINAAERLATEGRNEQNQRRTLEALSLISRAYQLTPTPRVRAAALFFETPAITRAARLD